MPVPEHKLNPIRTTWHITFGTYGTRLHGGDRPTVDKEHNQRGEPFLSRDIQREDHERQRMKSPPLYLTREQRLFSQIQIPIICERGGWGHRVNAAGPDHIHILLDVDRTIHGEKVRRLIKRWLGQALDERFTKPITGTWWAEEGSNRPIKDEAYLNNAYGYINDQRAH